jgi:NAD+ kinase
MKMRMLIVGDGRAHAVECAESAGFEVVERDPEVVLCHGGDGTLLRAERVWPSVPKIPARLSKGAQLCEQHTLPSILDRYQRRGLDCAALEMLQCALGASRFYALNDVVLRNDNPALALRFRLFVNNIELGSETTGDGVVLATPFGSTGYYHTLTRQRFDKGIGIAFNNCTRGVLPPVVVDSSSVVRVDVTRGPGVLAHDNDRRTIHLRQGHRFEISRADRRATVHGLDALACQTCVRYDEETFNPH